MILVMDGKTVQNCLSRLIPISNLFSPTRMYYTNNHITYSYMLYRPTRPITCNMGMKMPGWYDIVSLDSSEDRTDDIEGLKDAQSISM